MYCLTGLDLTNNGPLEVMSTGVVHRLDVASSNAFFSVYTQKKVNFSGVSFSSYASVEL